MKYQCSNHNDPRCRLCSHEKPHKEAQRWLTKEGCTEEGFFCELTGKMVVCKLDKTAEEW